jgi:MFS-type transporter involved in bile tolerance (Atg22 family)
VKRTSVWLLLDVLVATIVAILGNILASYLQERFNLTDSVRLAKSI